MKWLINRKKKVVPGNGIQEPSFLVPRDTIIYGSMDTAVPCRIEGHIEGDVYVKGSLIIGATAEVKGNITCNEIIVHGKVWHNIACTHKATVAAGGHVEGFITAPILNIDEQATVSNNLIEEEETAYYDTAINTVIAPLRGVSNENTWF